MPENGKSRLVTYTFKVDLPDAAEVRICGSFNNWDRNNLKLFKREGLWTATLNLKPDRYEYKYIVDGAWFLDPAAEKVTNTLGGENSVVVIKEQ
jgi:1,4-alpha-glucan branching enzyme